MSESHVQNSIFFRPGLTYPQPDMNRFSLPSSAGGLCLQTTKVLLFSLKEDDSPAQIACAVWAFDEFERTPFIALASDAIGGNIFWLEIL